jgi:predicted DNA-binding transcriptional regulator AlpA
MNAARPSKLLTEHDVALHYGLSVETIRKWRRLGSGPKFIKIGAGKGPVRYRAADIDEFDKAAIVQPKRSD